jgi:CRP-like cAMP-binding protein
LPPGDLAEIAAITAIQRLEDGDYLFREGQPSQGFFLVQ